MCIRDRTRFNIRQQGNIRRSRIARQPLRGYGFETIPQCDLPVVEKSRFKPTEESEQDFDEYKRVCDVLKTKCVVGMRKQQLDMIIRQLKKCHNLRCDYAKKYAEGTLDPGHYKILTIIRDRIQSCLNIKERSGFYP